MLATCSLRPSVLFGPGDYQLIPSIHACIAKRETPFVIGDGFNLWDVTHVDNVADAHVLAAENLVTSRTAAGEAFFIQNNEPITFRDFCLAIWAHFGHIPSWEFHIPKGLAYFAGLVCELATWATGSSTTLSRGSVQDACAVRYASGDKAKSILKYQPLVDLETGIRLSCQVSSEAFARGIRLSLRARSPVFFLLSISHIFCVQRDDNVATDPAMTRRQDYADRIGVKLPPHPIRSSQPASEPTD